MLQREKKCGNSYKQLSLEKLLIQKIELLKIKLSHKLPSKQNYLLSKTFTFDNSNSHCLEQIHFITLSFLGFELLRVNCSCSHFFSLTSQLGNIKFHFLSPGLQYSTGSQDSPLKSTHSVDCCKLQQKTVNEIFVQLSKKPPYFCTLK